MACRLVGAKPLSELLIRENAFQNVVCETAAILPRPRCVNQGVERQ